MLRKDSKILNIRNLLKINMELNDKNGMWIKKMTERERERVREKERERDRMRERERFIKETNQ